MAQQPQLVSGPVAERDFGWEERPHPDVRAGKRRGDGVVEVGRVLEAERDGRRLEAEQRDEGLERAFGLYGDPLGVAPERRVVEQDPNALGDELLGGEGRREEGEKRKEEGQLE